ncbi:MAG: hypothetical protein ACREBN_08930 [Burkholderiaceae bacterium]
MSSRNDTQLIALFDRWTVASAQGTRIEDLKVDADRVVIAARQVIALRGDTEAQKKLVAAMDDDTALALCVWFRDPSKAAELLSRVEKPD